MNENKDQWETCPTGEIGRMVDSVTSRQRRLVWVRFGGAATVLLLLAVGIVVVTKPTSPEKMSCPDCVTLMADYHKGSLAEESAKRVKHHLLDCPSCRKHFELNFQNGGGSTSQTASNRSIAMLTR